MTRLICLLAAGMLAVPGSATAQASFLTFESGHVRPLAQSPDGSRLFAVNTPDNRLEVFDVSAGTLTHAHSIPVGMEPVAVAARTNDEIWVVNHLSDSVSIVDLTRTPPQVVRTLLVGDEPRDIVFAGTGGTRAFITTAHRGQQRTHTSLDPVSGLGSDDGDPQLKTPGVGRADVWVFDATILGSSVGGTPVGVVTFFADTPRALAVSPDGSTVYAAAFLSGNQTSGIRGGVVPDGFDSAGPNGASPGGVPGPADNVEGVQAPETGLIVKFNGAAWRDVLGRDWSGRMRLRLPDHDVFSVNANTLAPDSVRAFDHVGTILFNMAVHPTSGKLFVTNTELPNHVRFEGPGVHGGSTVQGHLSESRITVIDPTSGAVSAKHLNRHIDYAQLHTDPENHIDPDQITHSLATPLQPVISSDGATMYVAAFGSGTIGVFPVDSIDDPEFATHFDPTAASARYIPTSGGPSGLVLDEANNRLYVMTRFDNAVQVIDPTTKTTLASHALHNPEPPSVVDGRPFLYDARITSGNGEASCASCHVFADFDGLAWNLGDPDAGVSTNPQPSATPFLEGLKETSFHPMKGPMTTQTMRGLATHGAMHWRGDRADGFFGLDPCAAATGISHAPCAEDLAFRNFIVAFEGLVGHDGLIDQDDMQAFADFALQIVLPPNPVRALDNALTTSQQAGFDKFFSCGPGPAECGVRDPRATDTVEDCDGCHRLDPMRGFYGSGGEQTFEGLTQNFKVAHMRNLYQKVGMFGSSTRERSEIPEPVEPARPGEPNVSQILAGGSDQGDQVRGFGYLHDGTVDTVASFLSGRVFSLEPHEVQQLTDLALAFDTDLAPVVGQQVTLTSTNSKVANPRIDLLIARATAAFESAILGGRVTECDLIVKGSVGGAERGWVRESDGLFRDDLGNTSNDAALRALANTDGPLTYTCAPPGSGRRMGIDRDLDGALDGNEIDAGSDPANVASRPVP